MGYAIKLSRSQRQVLRICAGECLNVGCCLMGATHTRKSSGEDLDIMAMVPAEPATKKQRVGASKASSSSSSLACAGASTVAPMTPPAVRARMTEKMDRGEIPKTTVEQRRRSCRTLNTEYFFIGDWGDAVKYNYVTPSLPNPYGWFWFPEPGNRWYLRPRLGG